MDETDSLLVENVKSIIAGGVGGVAAVITGHPFDLVKVRLQSGQYPSMATAVKSILSTSGPTGFYRGVVPPLVGVTPMFAVSFWGYDLGKNIVSSFSNGTPASEFSNAQLSTAGFLSAIPTTLVAAPMERTKIVLQTQDANAPKSMISAVKRILATGGIRSLFKGSFATLARDGPGSALYFATYEVAKKELTKLTGAKNGELSLTAVSTAGGLAGVSMWLVVFPIDTIKTRLTSNVNENISAKEAIASIYKKAGGIKGFFPGLGPALLRSFPANAATFMGVELTHQAFKKYSAKKGEPL
ncbi:Mitochondrial carnitine carrier [Wickerhamomyces ciferrii]|uniref:Mitochondrial carnitine carrier n=1 Tax=Wickerhamomyces ciferrii (strain ATCC 14091 / BCRC 22168 / CBS 111 / JCM 3599 / NBRC 0793 / NRRL Y-1031 F-60-10) TaxID=1206466 RepID=K0KA94_WICCF|nr:Mitochondrial carnitine carrier [Wickerhamomyces ciferrii]CCH41860.1 Mitochondrial carnitine carrier [Wickerhamomyces ciferrii]